MDILQNDAIIDTTSTAPNVLIMAMINSNTNLSANDINQHHLISTNSFDLNTGTSLSDDSGLPHTNSSISSSGSSRIGMCKLEFELAESDGEVSQFDSLDNCSDGGMSAENFNTLKKVPLAPIDPPPQFQDSPQTTLLRSHVLQTYALKLANNLISNAYRIYTTLPSIENNQCSNYDNDLNDYVNTTSPKNIINTDEITYTNTCNIYDEPPAVVNNNNNNNNNNNSKYKFKKMLYSPLHHGSNLSTINRPNSRNSLNSRLSSSHNSLSVTTTNKVDDSIFITQAMSHDALLGREMIDFYNVPIDSDIYALPIDFVKHHKLPKNNKIHRNKIKYTKSNINNIKKRRRNNYNNNDPFTGFCSSINGTNNDKLSNSNYNKYKISKRSDKRHSVPENAIEPMHMTLDEVKRYYNSLYSSSSDSDENSCKKNYQNKKLSSNNKIIATAISQTPLHHLSSVNKNSSLNNNIKLLKIKTHNNKKFIDDQHQNINNRKISTNIPTISSNQSNNKKSQFSFNLKQKFCSIFRFRKSTTSASSQQSTNFQNHNNNNNDHHIDYATTRDTDNQTNHKKIKFSTRALPPLPGLNSSVCVDSKINEEQINSTMDFATNIEKVKEYGWYWGPISSEAAEKILSNEPDGSFIVRDSSDDHYIFSLTFKLSGCIRHVRIEQDQGEFSFGARALFKSRTITEFIENAVEHSRSGRYLFFLHRRPEHGPLRVQLTNPVSRFRHIQSLQHMCRFVILKAVVRKDLIQTLPLPRRLLDYLSYKNCYSEQIESDSSQSQISGDGGRTPS